MHFFPQKVFSRKCLIKKDVSTSRISSILCKFSTELCTHHNTCYLSENSKYVGHWLGLKETASVQPSVKKKIWRSCKTARFPLNGVALKFISRLQLSSYVYSSHTGPGRFALNFSSKAYVIFTWQSRRALGSWKLWTRYTVLQSLCKCHTEIFITRPDGT